MSRTTGSELLRLAPDASAVGTARRTVAEQLRAAGLEDVVPDAQLAVSELVANAVIHARTEVTVRVELLPSGARVHVHDEAPGLPSPAALGATAMSGRGLVLVDAVSVRWGVEPDPAGGKTVWFEVDPAQPAPDAPAPLLATWLDLDNADAGDESPAAEPAGKAGAGHIAAPGTPRHTQDDEVTVVLPDVPVDDLLAAKMRVEDLIRDLKLVLLSASLPGDGGSAAGTAPEDEVQLARRLDAAVARFDRTRVQMRSQALQASARGERTTTLHLTVSRSAREVAVRYRQALEEADELSRSGKLLVGADLSRHAELRRWYLDEIARQLGEESPTPPRTGPPGSAGVPREVSGQASLRD